MVYLAKKLSVLIVFSSAVEGEAMYRIGQLRTVLSTQMKLRRKQSAQYQDPVNQAKVIFSPLRRIFSDKWGEIPPGYECA